MRLKFVRTTPSNSPDFPFQPGQIITLAALSPEAEQWLRNGDAEPLPEDDPDQHAVIEPVRVPEPKRKASKK